MMHTPRTPASHRQRYPRRSIRDYMKSLRCISATCCITSTVRTRIDWGNVLWIPGRAVRWVCRASVHRNVRTRCHLDTALGYTVPERARSRSGRRIGNNRRLTCCSSRRCRKARHKRRFMIHLHTPCTGRSCPFSKRNARRHAVTAGDAGGALFRSAAVHTSSHPENPPESSMTHFDTCRTVALGQRTSMRHTNSTLLGRPGEPVDAVAASMHSRRTRTHPSSCIPGRKYIF